MTPGVDARAAAVRDSLRGVLDRALADSAFPGAYGVVGTATTVYAKAGVGRLDWGGSATPDEHTLWDIASLTKVVGMTTAVMQLWERGAIDLDAPVQRYLPQWQGAHKERVTVRHLLTHSAGLPAYKQFFLENRDSAATLAMVYATPLDTLPGARMLYSDLGAILLGEIVQRVSGERIDRYLETHLFGPLGMTSTMYRPAESLRPRIAPTERDPWRGRLVHGEVHDENAFALGGVSAHAGLFSTAHDLTRFAQMMLNGGRVGGTRIVKAETIAMFTTVQDAALSHRALGWETPSGQNSAGRRLSRRAFGHTGFTGTSLWIDPERDLLVLLLSNRVNPTRENRRIFAVRIALADAVVAAIDGAPTHATPGKEP